MESRGGEGRVAGAAPPEGQGKDEAQSEIEARSHAQDDCRKEAQPISAQAAFFDNADGSVQTLTKARQFS